MAPANTTFYFASPVEGEPLFLPALERLQNLYPRAYNRGTTATTTLGLEGEVIPLSACTHTGVSGIDLFLGGGDPYPTRP